MSMCTSTECAPPGAPRAFGAIATMTRATAASALAAGLASQLLVARNQTVPSWGRRPQELKFRPMSLSYPSWLLGLCSLTCSFSLASTQQATDYPCPAASCWCHDSVKSSAIILTSNVSYSTVFNPLSNQEEDLTLDIYAPPVLPAPAASVAPALRPVALIIHGGGFSPTGEHSGKRQAAIRDRAQGFARRGFVAVSIDYRCERPYGGSDLWVDSVIDARSALTYLAANHEALHIDTTRIVAYGTSAGAVNVEGLAYFKDPNPGAYPRIKGSISISGCLFNDSTSLPAGRHVWNHLYMADKDSPALIDFHGTADPVVPYNNATARGGPHNTVREPELCTIL
jgi:dienelactone hydrolase